MPTAAELLINRNNLQNQLNDVNTPVSSSELLQYVNSRANNFQPLNEERRGIQAMAGNSLGQGIEEYTRNKSAGQPSASPLSVLNSLFNRQNQLRATSDLYGDMINTGQGNLSNIANSAAQILSQKQNQIKNLFDISNQDYNTAAQQEYQAAEAEKNRQFQALEAQKARDASMRAARAAAGGGGNPAALVDAALAKYFGGGKGEAKEGGYTLETKDTPKNAPQNNGGGGGWGELPMNIGKGISATQFADWNPIANYAKWAAQGTNKNFATAKNILQPIAASDPVQGFIKKLLGK